MKELKLGEDYRIPTTSCPNCGKILNAAASTEGDNKPTPGSVHICFGCLTVLIYGDDLQFRLPNDEEVLEIAGDEILIKTMNMLARFRKEHPMEEDK